MTPILSANGDVYQASYNGKDYYSTGYSSLDSALKAGKTLVMSGYTVSDLTAWMSLADGRVIIGVDGAGFSTTVPLPMAGRSGIMAVSMPNCTD
jgi:hypothetical protein